MTETIFLFILTGAFIFTAGWCGWLTNGSSKIYDKLNDIKERLVRLETKWDYVGRTAANVLHSPHTPELDALLEKYSAGLMIGDDWKRLETMVEMIENDITVPKEERALAGIIRAVCHDKINIPIGVVKKHSENTIFTPKP